MSEVSFRPEFAKNIDQYLNARDTMSAAICVEMIRLLVQASKAHPTNEIEFNDAFGSLSLRVDDKTYIISEGLTTGNKELDDFVEWHGRMTMIANEDVPQMVVILKNGVLITQ